MIEIWKPIKDFENIYEISNLGKVRNIKNNKLMWQYYEEKEVE